VPLSASPSSSIRAISRSRSRFSWRRRASAADHRGRRVQPLLLGPGDDLADQLVAVGEQLGKVPALRADRCGRPWPDLPTVAGDHPGVEAVGLGQDAEALGIGPHALGVDHRDRQAGLEKRRDQRALVAAGRFDHGEDLPALGAAVDQMLDDRLEAGWGIGNLETPLVGQRGAIEPGGGKVDAEDVDWSAHGVASPLSAGSCAPANCSGSRHGIGAGTRLRAR
jgi:hypothetical protein